MANTTFKGPVRSQNGFQELVDGVWTPVGGGGGGTVVSLLAPFPNDGSTSLFNVPAATEPSQITFVTTSFPPVGEILGGIDLLLQPSSGSVTPAIIGLYIADGDVPQPFMETGVTPGQPIAISAGSAFSQFQFTYLGQVQQSGYTFEVYFAVVHQILP